MRQAHGIVFLYSITLRDSFDEAKKWHDKALQVHGALPPSILVGYAREIPKVLPSHPLELSGITPW